MFTYITLIGVLKGVFPLLRPPGAGEPPVVWWIPPMLEGVLADITTADGSGFPSACPLGSTMVWGGLVLTLERGPYRMRLGVAGVVGALVAFSRLVLL